MYCAGVATGPLHVSERRGCASPRASDQAAAKSSSRHPTSRAASFQTCAKLRHGHRPHGARREAVGRVMRDTGRPHLRGVPRNETRPTLVALSWQNGGCWPETGSSRNIHNSGCLPPMSAPDPTRRRPAVARASLAAFPWHLRPYLSPSLLFLYSSPSCHVLYYLLKGPLARIHGWRLEAGTWAGEAYWGRPRRAAPRRRCKYPVVVRPCCQTLAMAQYRRDMAARANELRPRDL